MSADIRALTLADVPLLAPLIEQYWIFEDIAGFDGARIQHALERVVGDPRLASGWIARVKDRPVGYLLAVYVFSLEHLGLTAEIDEFFLLPSARGHGVGEALLRYAEAEFVRRGCTNVSLQLSRGNDKARAFYRRRGYAERAGFELLDKILPDA